MLDDNRLQTHVYDPVSAQAVQAAADLPTMRARNGMPTLAFEGVQLHSRVDPEREAEQLLEEYIPLLDEAVARCKDRTVYCMIFGPGLGYVVRALDRWAQHRTPSPKLHVICIEHIPEVARKALEQMVWEKNRLPVTWVVGPCHEAALKAYADSAHRVIVASGADFRLHRSEYLQTIGALDGHPRAERPMRILVPTPLYGGSQPIALHCAEAFRALGHTVTVLDLSEHYALFKAPETITSDVQHRKTLQGLFSTYLAELIVARALDLRADLVWAVAQTPLMPNALRELKHENVHTALWFVEDHTVFSYWRDLAPHYDAVFTIQREPFLSELRALGVHHAHYLPCAANPRVHCPLQLSPEERARFGGDVSFVGAGYYNRQQLFARLDLPGLKIWGNDWPAECAVACRLQEGGRRVSTEETAKIYNASRVNLNLHSSTHHVALNSDGDYVNPRTFEIAACGGFQVVDARSELTALFEPGKEIAVVRTAEEIAPTVKRYLANENEREAVARNALQRVLAEHTYEHRMRDALSFLEERLPRLADRKRGPNYVSTIKAAVADDPELMEFLSGLPEDEETDLDGIVSRITLGRGELTRAEGLFLLMKEFRDWGREKGVIS